MERPKFSLTASNYTEAKELAKAFKELSDSEAWNRLQKFVMVMKLQAGQRALAKPDEVAHWSSWADGVGFMLNVVRDAIDQVEVYENEEEEEELEVADFLSFGSAEPG